MIWWHKVTHAIDLIFAAKYLSFTIIRVNEMILAYFHHNIGSM